MLRMQKPELLKIILELVKPIIQTTYKLGIFKADENTEPIVAFACVAIRQTVASRALQALHHIFHKQLLMNM